MKAGHDRPRRSRAAWPLLAGTLILATSNGLTQPREAGAPLIKRDSRIELSPHVFVILDDEVSFVPNVGIVAGDRATLIVDTGLGERNGAIVLAEARRVSANTEFYLTATHYHPEHDLGATAFPANAKMLRWRLQQQDVDELGSDTNRRFAGFSPALAELLEGARFRPADILFEDAIRLDLGGVHVRVWGVGPTHTRGDTVFFVEEDRVLIAGDVVMPVFPAVNAQSSSIAKWIADLNELEALRPAKVVPAHGRMGGVELIRRCREYLTAVQSRVAAAKRSGATVEQVTAMLAPLLAAEFADLAAASGPAMGRINAAITAAYREAR
jgi:glyoxylase-like metal-dependent hydrolase (beta-lactamase superfamily II)